MWPPSLLEVVKTATNDQVGPPGLREAEKANSSSLVGYAERLRDFPTRVERLQKKLEQIEDRLLAMKQARDRGASCVAKHPAADPARAPVAVVDPAAYAASPLF